MKMFYANIEVDGGGWGFVGLGRGVARLWKSRAGRVCEYLCGRWGQIFHCVGGGGGGEGGEGEVALKEGKGGAPTAHSHTLWQSSPIQGCLKICTLYNGTNSGYSVRCIVRLPHITTEYNAMQN